MSNKRIFYATQAVLLGGAGATLGSSHVVKGVQSLGVNTTIGHKKIADLGKPSPISILEDKPLLDISLERILSSASDIIFPSAGGNLLADATHATEYDMLLLVGEEARDQIDTSGAVTQAELKLSYLQIASVSYTISVDGPITEAISFSGHNKEWVTTRTFSSTGELGYTHAANVGRRGDYNTGSSVIPSEVKGAIQNITISFDLSRRQVVDLGKRQGASTASEVNRYKLLDIPIQISTEITTVIAEKDFSSDITAQSFSNTPASEQIKAVITLGGVDVTFDMGSENYLDSVNRSGGDAGGGNSEASYSYTNWNTFSIS